MVPSTLRSLIALLKAIEAAHPAKKRIHVYLDNASYHHANIVRAHTTSLFKELVKPKREQTGFVRHAMTQTVRQIRFLVASKAQRNGNLSTTWRCLR